MDVYLAFVPISARLTSSEARELARVLIPEDENKLSLGASTVLAMSLLHGSWTKGRMNLGAHLAYLTDAIKRERYSAQFLDVSPFVADAQSAEDYSAAKIAGKSIAALADEVEAYSASTEDLFSIARQALSDLLELQAEDPQSRRLVNGLMSVAASGQDSHTRKQLQQVGTGAFLIGLPSNPREKMQAFHALLATGLMNAVREGTAHSPIERKQSQLQHSAIYAPAQSEQPQVLWKEDSPTSADPAQEPHGAVVYSREAVIEVLQRMPDGGALDDNRKQRNLMIAMGNDAGIRKLAQIESLDVLSDLYDRFPHFKEVLDFVARRLALAGCGEEGKPAVVPPLLLRGNPGTGKTYFAQELALALGTPFHERDMSAMTEAWILNGMDASWKNSKPGLVFDTLIHGKFANPCILLNEVDKVAESTGKNSPLAPLYALLEPASAATFVDEFVPVPINASKVIWILTANTGFIPEPVLSRLEEFDIKEPSPEQCLVIAQSVWRNICKSYMPKGHGYPAVLPEDVLAAVSRLNPRVMRKALTDAASNAALDGRRFLLREDLLAGGYRYGGTSRRSIGFVTAS